MSWFLGFILINVLVILVWVLFLVFFKLLIIKVLVYFMFWLVLMGLIYGILLVVVMGFGVFYLEVGFLFEGVQVLFDYFNGVLIGWLYYLVFDLFVGVWIVCDVQCCEILYIVIVFCLFGVFLFGLVGLLFYVMIWFFLGKGFFFDEC